jgi:hypothetical protein
MKQQDYYFDLLNDKILYFEFKKAYVKITNITHFDDSSVYSSFVCDDIVYACGSRWRKKTITDRDWITLNKKYFNQIRTAWFTKHWR